MKKGLFALALLLLMVSPPLHAQTGNFNRIVLGTNCTLRTGTGDPEGVVTGRVCDTFWRTDGGSATTVYIKTSGTGNTGWEAVGGGGGTGTVTHTAGALTANQLVIGNAVDDLKVLGSLGTTSTLLHGNAGGAPTYGAVALASEVSGTLANSHLDSTVALADGSNTNSGQYRAGDGSAGTPNIAWESGQIGFFRVATGAISMGGHSVESVRVDTGSSSGVKEVKLLDGMTLSFTNTLPATCVVGEFYVTKNTGVASTCTATNTWTTLAAGGVQGAWVLSNTGGTALSGVDHVDQTGLSACTDVGVTVRGASTVSSTSVGVRVSTDNGSTFLSSSGDYISVTGNGVEANETGLLFDSLGNSTSTRTGDIEIARFNVAAPKTARSNFFSTDGINLRMVTTTTALNAVRIFSNSGNFNAGTVYFFCR